MNTRWTRLIAALTAVLSLAVVILATGCAGTPRPPKKSGFLFNYSNLRQVDETTWRFVNTNRLALYSKFMIGPIQILPTEFDGRPITEEEKTRATDFIRESVTKALESRGFEIVPRAFGEIGEIRVAITDVYRSRSQIGLTVEGSIVDSASAFQAAAVMKTELAPAQLGSWWDNARGRGIINAWAERMAEAVADAHAHASGK